MKRTVKVKNLIAFTAVLILLFSITVIPAYADFPPITTAGRRLGAWVMSALTAMNVAVTSTVSTSKGADLVNFLADPLDVTYSYTEAWEDRPTIQIWDDYVTIDGTSYTDIWLSNEAASKFKTDGMDFNTAYSIVSNTNGTFASGDGYLDNSMIFDVSGEKRSQTITTPFAPGVYDTGSIQIHQEPVTGVPTYLHNYGRYNGANGAAYDTSDSYFPMEWKVSINSLGDRVTLYSKQKGSQNWSGRGSFACNYTHSPFDFDYVAGTIDSIPLTPDQGMMIRVPSNTPGLQNFITNNYYLTEPTVVDPSLDPNILLDIDDLADILVPVLVNLDNDDITFVSNHTSPAPQPDTPIVDATVPQVVNPIINEITNYGDQITQQIPQIIETIPTIDSICENIDTAPYHDLDTGLDHLPSFFLPFITDLRSALSIWHYVTEWLAQISTTFAFVTGSLAGTSIMTPIYAAIAGFMCIKIYRRMTA